MLWQEAVVSRGICQSCWCGRYCVLVWISIPVLLRTHLCRVLAITSYIQGDCSEPGSSLRGTDHWKCRHESTCQLYYFSMLPFLPRSLVFETGYRMFCMMLQKHERIRAPLKSYKIQQSSQAGSVISSACLSHLLSGHCASILGKALACCTLCTAQCVSHLPARA